MGVSLLRTPLWRTEVRKVAILAVRRLFDLVGRPYRSTLARRVRVVAVVGSFGKSTTARATGAVLGCDGSSRHPGHMVVRLKPSDRYAVMEVGIHRPGQMAAYARVVQPDVVVVTSIGSEHNPTLSSLAVTRSEKIAMVRGLRQPGLAVLNGDDPNVMWMAEQVPTAVMTFGFGSSNDVRASDVAMDWPHGTTFVLHAAGTRREVRVRLMGKKMIYPVLGAVAVALAEGLDLDTVLPRLEALPPTPGRLEPVALASGAHLLCDQYKAPVETVEVALDVLAEIPARRRIVVLGDLEEPQGDFAEVSKLYQRLGARAAAVAHRSVFVHVDTAGPRPRYGAGVNTALEAARVVAGDLREGDAILVKGAHQQRLDRVVLALTGHDVRCNLQICTAWVSCQACPMLERGWKA